MSSARETYYTARQISVAFLSEYLIHRATLWGSTSQTGANIVGSSHATERQQVCMNFIRYLKVAETQEQLDAIILDLDKEARLAQREKMTDENEKISMFTAIYNAAYNAIAPLFVKENSLFAKVCHATRTCLVAAKKAKNIEEYHATINKLRTNLNEQETLIDHYLDRNLSIVELESKRDETYYQILAMQDWKTIKQARINHTLPSSLPTWDVRSLKLPNNILIKLDIPLVYNDNYCDLYFSLEIHDYSDRLRDFYDQLQLAGEEMEKRPIDIVSGKYFQPLTLLNPPKLPANMNIFAPAPSPTHTPESDSPPLPDNK